MLFRHFRFIILNLIICLLAFQAIAVGIEPPLTGEFPFENIIAIYSGPFTHADRSDLLVVQGAGSVFMGLRQGGMGMGASKLALYTFDGSQFQKVWEDGALMLGYSRPKDGPFSTMTWCYGDFDGDGRYSIVTCNVRDMWQYTFVDSIFEHNKRPLQEMIKTPDSIWIDQLIACDINGDSIDELVAMNYPDNPDSCCKYHAVIYNIEGDRPAGRSLVEIWHGTNHIGSNYGEFPPDHFISKCRIEGIPGEVPVIMGSQSDMSLTFYDVLARASTGEYEIERPFPRPLQSQLRKGDPGAAAEKDRLSKSEVGPISGVIINDGNRILHYGPFEDYNNPDPRQRLVGDQFAVLEDGHWRLLQKDDPTIGGLLTRFTLAPGKSGWLFIKDGKYFFYDKLPVAY